MLKLLKALYRLQVALLLWLSHLVISLKNLGLTPIYDTFYIFTNRDLIIFFFIDDIVVLFHKSKEAKYLDFQAKLMSIYKL